MARPVDEKKSEAILDAAARVKAAHPGAVYCCDPVIGDVGRGEALLDGAYGVAVLGEVVP